MYSKIQWLRHIIFMVLATWMLSPVRVAATDAESAYPLHQAVRDGAIKRVRLLLNWGQSVNQKDKANRTPLHYAAANNRKEISALLLENSADVNAKDAGGLTPMHYARKRA